MKRFFLLIWILFFSGISYAQKTLVVEKIGTSKKLLFRIGDDIKLHAGNPKRILHSYLWNMSDSVLVIGNGNKVMMSDVLKVNKEVYFPKLMKRLFLMGGIGYFSVTAFNHLINNEQVFPVRDLVITGSLFTGAAICIPLSSRNVRIGHRWKIKVLDIEIR